MGKDGHPLELFRKFFGTVRAIFGFVSPFLAGGPSDWKVHAGVGVDEVRGEFGL